MVALLRPSRKRVEEKFGNQGRIVEKVYPLEKGSMERITSDLEAISEEWDIGIKKTFVINFICEEILLSIMKFGLSESGKKKEFYISIMLMEKDEDLVLRIRDNVSHYNPFESQGDDIDRGVLELIKKKTKYCDYQRKMVFNYLYLIL